MRIRIKKSTLVIAAMFVFLLACTIIAYAVPSGPLVTLVTNETNSPAASTKINTTGGSITIMRLNATTQNPRWKAYVGNVTGTLTLDDASDNSIFQWSLTRVTGEVYATRSSGNLNWTGVNCSNSTHLSFEDIAMNQTNLDDNISRTFNTLSHSGFFVGTREILQNTCPSVHTLNSSRQQSRFEEIVLYDGTNTTNGNIIYAAPLQQDAASFDGSTYDFQMIVPENGLATWTSSTAYYFYVELS
jgi:hypothetical protein